MKESATAGISYIRSVAARYANRIQEFFQENDIHVHIPEGAVPKDGPSQRGLLPWQPQCFLPLLTSR